MGKMVYFKAMDQLYFYWNISIMYSSIPGTSLDETDRQLQEVEKIITSTPEVSAYSRRTGTQMGFFITEPNKGDYLIELKKNRNKTTDQVTEEIRKRIEEIESGLETTIPGDQVFAEVRQALRR